MNRVVILSPSRFSLYTICATELLVRRNVDVKAIVVRKLFDRNRFFSEFRRDGSRLIRKIWKKLVLREKGYKNKDYETIASFMKKEGIRFKRVDDFKHRYKIPVMYCNDLNDTVVVECLKTAKPDMVVFTGGGIIRSGVLKHAGEGVLNCHMGILPRYRGMDVVEWPMIEDDFRQIGMTVHFMDEGVDTGDILRVARVEARPGDSIAQIREKFEPIMCREIVNTCVGYFNGEIKRKHQKPKDGRQYFIMHPRLKALAEIKIKSYAFPPG